jgi:hypothetical protein
MAAQFGRKGTVNMQSPWKGRPERPQEADCNLGIKGTTKSQHWIKWNMRGQVLMLTDGRKASCKQTV